MIALEDLANLLIPLATVFKASISKPESVSSKIAILVSRTAICKISLRFFSPPEKPSLTFLFKKLGSMPTNSNF